MFIRLFHSSTMKTSIYLGHFSFIKINILIIGYCYNLSFGLTTKARACKVANQKEAWEWRKVWRNELSHSQRSFHLGSLESPWTPESSESNCRGQNPTEWKVFLYHWKVIELQMSKLGSHDPFEHFKHELWAKERPEVKLGVWLPTIKSKKLTQFPCVQVTCNILLESSRQKLQLCFRPNFNQRSAHKVMGLQSHRSPNFGNFGTPIWES
jgi:hypothetical protein